MTTTPWLSQIEVDDLCEPLKQHAAQVRFIRRLGLAVRTKPNGAPLVMRTHLEEAANPAGKHLKHGKTQPDRTGLLAWGRKNKVAA